MHFSCLLIKISFKYFIYTNYFVQINEYKDLIPHTLFTLYFVLFIFYACLFNCHFRKHSSHTDILFKNSKLFFSSQIHVINVN